jgi:hypothetical protein
MVIDFKFPQNLHHLWPPPDKFTRIASGARCQLHVSPDHVLVARGDYVFDCMPLHTDAPAAFRNLLRSSVGRGEYHGAGFAEVRV